MRIQFLEIWCTIINLVPFDLYWAEVEDTRSRMAFLDGGALLNLPLFYLEGMYMLHFLVRLVQFYTFLVKRI